MHYPADVILAASPIYNPHDMCSLNSFWTHTQDFYQIPDPAKSGWRSVSLTWLKSVGPINQSIKSMIIQRSCHRHWQQLNAENPRMVEGLNVAETWGFNVARPHTLLLNGWEKSVYLSHISALVDLSYTHWQELIYRSKPRMVEGFIVAEA